MAQRTTKTMSAADQAAFDRMAIEALATKSDGATALYLGVWDPVRGRYVTAYGERAPGQSATVADHNRIGSVTKTFTSVAVLRLVADGKVALRDTLETLVPGLARAYPALAPVTIDQLLGMRTGIGDYGAHPNEFTRRFLSDPTATIPAGFLIRLGLSEGQPPLAIADEPQYSNTNYIILGEVIAAVTGRRSELAVTEAAVAMGLHATALEAPDDRNMPEPATHGYIGPAQVADHSDRFPPALVPGTDVSDWSMSAAGAAGGMYSTIEDLGDWAASGYGSTLLPRDLVELRLTPHGAAAYGYGIMRAGDWIGHGGELHGWFVMTGFNVETGATFVAIVNSGGGNAAVEELAGYAFPDSPFGS